MQLVIVNRLDRMEFLVMLTDNVLVTTISMEKHADSVKKDSITIQHARNVIVIPLALQRDFLVADLFRLVNFVNVKNVFLVGSVMNVNLFIGI